MTHGITLSKSLCPQTQDERIHMSLIPLTSKGHWVVVKNILKYLKRTKDIFLIYGDEDSDIHAKGYMDANFQYDRDDSKSQLGYVFTLNHGAVSWKVPNKRRLLILQSK